MVTHASGSASGTTRMLQRHYPAIVLLVGVLLFILFNNPFQYVALLSALVCIAVSVRRRRQRVPSYANYQLVAGVIVLLLMVFYELTRPVYIN